MDVELYVYDLSRGLARQMSMAFLGTQIDAVYHTALVFGNVEYFFGQGVQTCYPGSTHHGQPMQKISLGRTELDLDTILEYLESLKTIYTAESYDLFVHNCNNFSNDFATFLVGKGIPDHISSLPQTVLNTPFGQMLKPQLDQAMRGITQAPIPPSQIPGQARGKSQSKAHVVTQLSALEELLLEANTSCAVIFFTSSTCAPCKVCYRPFHDLADEFAGRATLIKVDIDYASEIAAKYQIHATPTFVTFAKGEKVEEWAGADPTKLTSNVRLLVQMTHPAHPHARLELPILQQPYDKPELYVSVPPLEKMVAKLGSVGESNEVQALKAFVQNRQENPANATLPELRAVSSFVRGQVGKGPTDAVFALIDLLRVALADPRVSGYFAEEMVSSSAILTILSAVCDWDNATSSPTKLVTIQLACNAFSSPLTARRLAAEDQFRAAFLRICTWLLLDESRIETRKGAANLALNLLKPLHSARLQNQNSDLSLPNEAQIELAACLLESMQHEKDSETLRKLLLALGLLAYGSVADGELHDLMSSMGAADTVKTKVSVAGVDKQLVGEVAQVLS